VTTAQTTPLPSPSLADERATDLLQPLTTLGQLTSLQLQQLRSNGLELSHLSCLPQLQQLVLSFSADWTRRRFSRLSAAVLQRLSSLQHLHLGSCFGLRRSAVPQLAQLTCLTHLWVLDLRVEGAAADAVLPLPQLRELGCDYIAGPAVELAGALLPQLTQLCVGELWVHYDEHQLEEALQAADALCSTQGCLLGLLPLPQLQQLEVSVDDSDWAPLAAELAQQTSLTSLSLRRAAGYDDSSPYLGPLVPALQQLGQLQHLTFDGAELDLGCWEAIAGMPQLQSLKLDNCSLQLPHLSLLHRCAALEEISVSCCGGVESDALLAGMLIVKPGLRRLVMDVGSSNGGLYGIDVNPLEGVDELAAFLGVQLELHGWR
jgi:hypothetical protein